VLPFYMVVGRTLSLCKISLLHCMLPQTSSKVLNWFYVCNVAGSMRKIDVIDVARQEDCKMLMRDWTEYYNSQDRRKIYNVISLEFSNTK